MALAARALADGSVVAVPTDTVYGLAVDPAQPEAVERLFALKERPTDGGPARAGPRTGTGGAVAGRLGPAATRLADRYWPGPLTLVVPAQPGFVADLGGSLVPADGRDPVARPPGDRRAVPSSGPLAVTSANRHGAPPATTAASVEEEFGDVTHLAMVLDGGRCAGTPSTVVECRGSAVRCLRDGAVPYAVIDADLQADLPPDGEGRGRGRG